MTAGRPQFLLLPLAPFERDGLRAALKRAGLPFDDVGEPGRHFWRFEENDVPVGFGGIEVSGDSGLLRSVLTLPPLRHRGLGGAITSALEGEAVALGCRTLYVFAKAEIPFFAHQGFAPRGDDGVPAWIVERLPAGETPESSGLMAKTLA